MFNNGIPSRRVTTGASLFGCGALVLWMISVIASLALVVAIIYAIIMGVNHFFL